MSDSEHINKLLKSVPKKTGVYQYYDKNKKLIYVGKAKNLKNRVSSYFKNRTESLKTKVLVSKIKDVKYIIVKTELDALLLENNLIKTHQPKYNVMLKDDKTYPWICIKKEPFPRVFQTRRFLEDGSEYFGPYSSVRLIKTILEFLHELYPLRSCNLILTNQNIKKNKFNVCLEYHMKNCLGPCVGKQTNDDYLLAIKNIKKIITGDIASVIKYLKDNMSNFSKNLEYEKAQAIKEKIHLLNNYQFKSTIVNPKINNVDVFTIISEESVAFVNFLKINSGAIIQAHTLEINKKLEETEEELLQLAIIEIRQKFKSVSKNIYCSHYLGDIFKRLTVTVPKIGDKKKLIDLSLKNARHMQLTKRKEKMNLKNKRNSIRILTQLKTDLKLKKIPVHIECFDNSNTQGTNPVSACVVFKNGRPSKKEYRNFNIKTVSGPDDFASMKEVVFRRYSRLLSEKKSLPELIIIDGGKGQLNSALESLKQLNLSNKISIISIAKRLEEICIPEEKIPIYLNKRSESLKLIQQLRDEAHRFSIAHHRKKRNNNAFVSSLENITGIGPKTIEILIRKFGSKKQIMTAKKEELITLIGKYKANKILKKT